MSRLALGKRGFNGSPRSQALSHGAVAKASQPTGICETHDLAPIPDKSSSGIVAGLFGACGPFAVTAGVPEVIVNALKRVRRRWSRPHIFVEGFKFEPTLADRYSPPAVSFVKSRGFVGASLHHTCPYFVFGDPAKPVRSHALCGRFAHVAAARLGVPAPNLRGVRNKLCSAVALIKPEIISAPPLKKSERRKAICLLSGL